MSSNVTESPDAARYELGDPSSDLQNNLSADNLKTIQQLAAELRSNNLKKGIQAVRSLSAIKAEEADRVLIDSLYNCEQIDPLQGEEAQGEENKQKKAASRLSAEQKAIFGCTYQYLYTSASTPAKAFIEQAPNGIVKTVSERDVTYDELQELLIQKNYQAADKLTTELMCAIAGEDAIKRKWVYFTEVSQFPNADILTIDTLWRTYSEDKFGWSQQRNLWLRLGKNWERLWPQIKWQTSDGAWTRYPTEFVWELDSAPVGHLPLFNQLRGVRVMNALLEHPVWATNQ